MFRQVKQNRVFQDVIEQIQEAILNGKLSVGDKLPAERKLKETFQTSRGTLREALRVLEQKGLIEIRTGVNGGAYVKSITTHQVSESLDLLIKSQKVSLRELAEFREGVEGIVTSLAAGCAKRKDIALLKDLLKEAGVYVAEGVARWDDFIDNDNEFHLTLAEIAGNQVYKSVLQTVHHNINKYYNQFLAKEKRIMKENYADLCEIADAVSLGDSDTAAELARKHVRRFNTFMENTRNRKKKREKSI